MNYIYIVQQNNTFTFTNTSNSFDSVESNDVTSTLNKTSSLSITSRLQNAYLMAVIRAWGKYKAENQIALGMPFDDQR